MLHAHRGCRGRVACDRGAPRRALPLRLVHQRQRRLRGAGVRDLPLLADGEPYESALALKHRELDLALVFGFDHWPAWVDYGGLGVCSPNELELVPLFDDPFLLVCPRDHPLARPDQLSLAHLEKQRIIGGAPWAEGLRQACERAGVQARFDLSHRATGFEAYQSLVAAGGGLTFMPRLALGWLREELVARHVPGAPVRRVSAA
ncbi:MAG: hypothetical protein H0V26_07570, partial [Solirubrobacterales bacterium]|nr:hypothetical protein [Solirubrobacterales bacterium]